MAVSSWLEEINVVFKNTLIPVANIDLLENKSYQKTNCTDGAIFKQKITFNIGNRNRKMIDDLQVFDTTGMELQCTYPGCRSTKYWFTRWLRNSNDSETKKRFLCRTHVKKMDIYLQEIFDKNGVLVPSSRSLICSSEEISLLCGLVHNASCQPRILHLVTRCNKKTRLIQDMFINVRNYFMILHSLIELDGDILPVALPYIMGAVLTVVKTMHMNEQPVDKLVHAVEETIDKTLFFYGIMYCWETKHLENNPYKRIGIGIGGMVGVLSTIISCSVATGLGAMTILSQLGSAVGNAWYREHRRLEVMKERRCEYQRFRELHKQNNQAHSWMMYVVALLVAIIAVQVACLVVTQ